MTQKYADEIGADEIIAENAAGGGEPVRAASWRPKGRVGMIRKDGRVKIAQLKNAVA